MINFIPTPDTAAILNHLLDIYERRDGQPKQAVRVRLEALRDELSGYYSQSDPTPRVTVNEQVGQLAKAGYVSIVWEPQQTHHLLAEVTLNPTQTAPLYELLGRQPLAEQRRQLREMLLAERSHLSGWRRKAVEHTLTQIQAHKSPSPFSLTDLDWNRDLLTALHHLPDEETPTEIPYRVFSVRVFNDSKRFESLKDTLARLARRHRPVWRELSPQETLQELGLVANPGHLYLYGPWQLVDSDGQVMSLSEFYPSVGLPAALVARLQEVRVEAERVVCVENLASFYELIRHQGPGLASVCLWGNPSPTMRHLLYRLVENLAESTPLLVWADIDYGGLRILAHVRQQISARFQPYLMDQPTLAQHARWGQPLSNTDERNLARLRQHAALQDMTDLIDYMLLHQIKLEQEAVSL